MIYVLAVDSGMEDKKNKYLCYVLLSALCIRKDCGRLLAEVFER
jgi:hypothetical protein